MPTPLPLDAEAFFEPPQTWPAEGLTAPGVRGIFLAGPRYKGKPTRIFAWLGVPKSASPRARVPGMVLVHGGGGGAFPEWVRLWTRRGYAAIAMDTCGCTPPGTYQNWTRHADGGPPGWGGLDQIDQPVKDQWCYHASAAVILSHSLLRSLPEANARRIGLTGISWGGFLTCLAAGLDRRFRFAVPVYGCGYLHQESNWLKRLSDLPPAQFRKWVRLWEPSNYLPHARMPFLWVNGTNDFAFWMPPWQRSYRTPPGERWLSLQVRMKHGHGGLGEKPREIHRFADQFCLAGPELLRVTAQGCDGRELWARFRSPLAVANARLCYTRDAGSWPERKWLVRAADLDARAQTARAAVPDGATAAYLNFVDDRGCIVSAEHYEPTSQGDAQ